LYLRDLGTSGLRVGVIGLGCAPMSGSYNLEDRDDSESIAVIRRAVELGVTLLDTSDVYGPFTNELLLGRATRRIRDQVVLATKGGLVKPADGSYVSSKDARPESLRRAVDASLRRLQTDYIDLYQLHRVDPGVPIEESWGAMKEIVEAGKARAIGLSEVTVEQLARAALIHPVATVQSELSLWTRDPLVNGVLDWCASNGTGFLAYAPLGRGFLTGTVRDDQFGAGDYRSEMPRFRQPAIEENKRILEIIQAVAHNHAASLAQVSLAWIIAQGDNIVSIPGTKRLRWLEENAAAASVTLGREDLRALDNMPGPVSPRY
jgi:aryl-alcohol dehydrogenase-like predicted oxidoreductase